MKLLQCDTCFEKQRPQPRPLVSLDIAIIPWQVIGVDLKEIKNQRSRTKSKWMVLVDEATRFTVVKELFRLGLGEHRNATTQELVTAYD